MSSALRFTFVAAASLILAPAAAAAAQRLGGGGSDDVSAVRVFLALLVSLLLASFAILLLRQRLGGRPIRLLPRLHSAGERIRLVESRRITPQAEISLVEVDGAEYLLLVSASGPLLLKGPGARKARLEGRD
jgi:flagellar biogenesis protein FliO